MTRKHRHVRRAVGATLAAFTTLSLCSVTPATAAPALLPAATNGVPNISSLLTPLIPNSGGEATTAPTNNEGSALSLTPNIPNLPGIELPTPGASSPKATKNGGNSDTPDDGTLQRLLDKSPLLKATNRPTPNPIAGTLVSKEPTQLIIDNQEWTSKAYRIKYNSTDSLSRPSVDSGVYVEPIAPWTGDGPRPVIAIAPGTQGAGPQCDPSTSMHVGPSVSFGPTDVVAPYEIPALIEHLRRGAAVVMIDHHRNPEGHQEYVDNITAGQTMLDAAKVGTEISGNKNAPVGLYGYSQGGSAAAAAAERASFYAPELNISAAAAGGVPSDLEVVLNQVDGTSLTAVSALGLTSILDKDPELRDYLYSREMTPQAAKDMETIHNLCAGGDIFGYAYRNTTAWTKDGSSLADLIKKYPAFVQELERQKIGEFTPHMPTLLYNGTNDDIIPVEQARTVRDRWLTQGANLEYFEDPLPTIPGRTGANHIATLFGNLRTAADFLWKHLPHQKKLLPLPTVDSPNISDISSSMTRQH